MLRSAPSDAADYGREPPNHGPALNPNADQHRHRNMVPGATYGRKERCATLTAETIAVLREWLKERQGDQTTRCSPAGEAAT